MEAGSDSPTEDEQSLRLRYSRMSSVKDPRVTIKENLGVIVVSAILISMLSLIAIFALVSYFTSSKSEGQSAGINKFNKTRNSSVEEMLYNQDVMRTSKTYSDTNSSVIQSVNNGLELRNDTNIPDIFDNGNIETNDEYMSDDSESSFEKADLITGRTSETIELFSSTTTLKVPGEITTTTRSTEDVLYDDIYDIYDDLKLSWNSRHLPGFILPVRYDLHLDIVVRSISGFCGGCGLYTGNVTITIQVKNTTEFIVVHATNDFRLNADRIRVTKHNKDISEQIEDVTYNHVFEYYVIKLTGPLKKGLYDVVILNFMGCISNQTIGILLTSYKTTSGELR